MSGIYGPFALIPVSYTHLLGIGGAGLGAITGIASLIFGIIAVVFCLTAAAFITGVCLLVAGIVFLVASPLDSGLMFGIAIAGIGVGLLGACLLYTSQYYTLYIIVTVLYTI